MVAIIIAIILGVFVCIYGRCTASPWVFAIIGSLLPLLTLLVIWIIPKESTRNIQKDESLISGAPITRWVFVLISYIFFFVAVFCLFLIYCSKPFEAYRVSSSISSTR